MAWLIDHRPCSFTSWSRFEYINIYWRPAASTAVQRSSHDRLSSVSDALNWTFHFTSSDSTRLSTDRYILRCVLEQVGYQSIALLQCIPDIGRPCQIVWDIARWNITQESSADVEKARHASGWRSTKCKTKCFPHPSGLHHEKSGSQHRIIACTIHTYVVLKSPLKCMEI